MKYKSVLELAFYRLKGYCEKRVGCDKCRFSDGDGCILASGMIPADWELPKEHVEGEK